MILYEKRGRRYYPVRDTMAYEGLDKGHWYVGVLSDGRSTFQYNVTPDRAPVVAALHEVREVLIQSMEQAQQLRVVHPSHISDKEKKRREKAWQAYLQSYNDEPDSKPLVWFEGISMRDVVDKGVKALGNFIEWKEAFQKSYDKELANK